ncbi:MULTISPECIES: ThiF family adenylyltransferase [unclassified Streptomyces]|uniref:ThiF family adenylyltransferase n=1 Tax=unclassified Streptomyces TaxID=2593676 RepID=UPI0006F261DF|nr:MULTISPECIES: ThiF family adenylyltransferase [unclassified Streptomyces]KQX58745.1 thiamine biosynthesis protein ThiF [Streptomyces sp. Root1304]KRB00006.1 thiamine biosynthesis protein ThiF [Streptomyces sp. Root66D1]
MHPMVKPALRRAWRGLRCVQFGVTPAHAVVLDPVDPGTGSVLGLLDGTRGVDLLRAEARARGLPEGHLDALLGRLESAGLLADAATGRPGRPGPAAGARDSALDPLRADLASLSVVHPEPDRAARTLAARRALRVQVRGAGRVGTMVAALLSAAGVGTVEVLDSGRVEPWETSPGGLPPESVGERRATAARRLVGSWRRGRGAAVRPGAAAAGRGPGERGGGTGLSLVVVTPRDGLGAYVPDPLPAGGWVATGTPHLYAGVLEATGTVGPLVLPGGTACARCLQEARTDGEPVWPRLLAQWRSGAPHPLPACDLGLATAVAGLAAAHALVFLDGDLPASTGTRWEASLPLLEWRAERLRPHPACPCGAARAGEGERASAAGGAQDTMAG